MSGQSSFSSSDHKIVVPAHSQRNTRQEFSRAKHLRLPSQPLHIPVPPSLLQSPHLSSPQSIFRRASSAPKLPSEEDEEWLRDTIPLSLEMPNGEGRTNASSQRPSLSHNPESTKEERGKNSELRMLSNAPPSPPLVCCHHAATPTIPRLAQQGYFISKPLP